MEETNAKEKETNYQRLCSGSEQADLMPDLGLSAARNGPARPASIFRNAKLGMMRSRDRTQEGLQLETVLLEWAVTATKDALNSHDKRTWMGGGGKRRRQCAVRGRDVQQRATLERVGSDAAQGLAEVLVDGRRAQHAAHRVQ